jgi:nickel/cobalt exporter
VISLNGLEQQLVLILDHAVIPVVALPIAVAIGVVHGFAPGHGKAVAAAYLVGAHARRGHAVALAAIVATMHTASVLALGLLWWLTVDGGRVSIATTTRWAQLALAMVVLILGVVLTRRRWRDRRAAGHYHGPPADRAPWSWPGLVGIAAAGGLLPSPSAFLVLISGLLTGRVGFAVAMVAAFGLGLSTTVLAVGLLTVAGRDWLNNHDIRHRRLRRALTELPFLGAVGVLVGGCLLLVIALDGVLAGR